MLLLFRALVTLLILSLLTACTSSPLLRHQAGLSRDDYYLDFSRTQTSYIDNNLIGGEHQIVYHLLGFAGDHFLLQLSSDEGIAEFSLHGEGFVVQACERLASLHRQTCEVTISAEHTWVGIPIYAYPVDAYRLEVSLLK